MSFHFTDFTVRSAAASEVRPLPAIYVNCFGKTSQEQNEVMDLCLAYCEALNVGDPMIFCDVGDPATPERAELRTYCAFNPCADVVLYNFSDVASTLADHIEFEAYCRINSVRLHLIGGMPRSLLDSYPELSIEQDLVQSLDLHRVADQTILHSPGEWRETVGVRGIVAPAGMGEVA